MRRTAPHPPAPGRWSVLLSGPGPSSQDRAGGWLGHTEGGWSQTTPHPPMLFDLSLLPPPPWSVPQPPGKALTGRSVGPSSALPGDPYSPAAGPADFEISPSASSDSGESTSVRAPRIPNPVCFPHPQSGSTPGQVGLWPPAVHGRFLSRAWPSPWEPQTGSGVGWGGVSSLFPLCTWPE